MTMAESTTDLRSSPAARAFFAALDGKGAGNQKQSAFVRKKIQTLGWRNRYSQDEFYPIEITGGPAAAGSAAAHYQFSVLQVQRGELEGTYGTGATVWPAAIVMIKYLERHRDSLVKGKKVIDLGSGTGVTSIAAAILGAKHVICTDGEPRVVDLARDNIERASKQLEGIDHTVGSESNKTASSSSLSSSSTTTIADCPVDVQTYWWGTGTILNGNDCDVILVADCVLPKLYPIAPLVEALDQLLVNPTAVAIFSYEHRYYQAYDPRVHFIELAAAKNLMVQVIPTEQHDSVYSVEDIEIWHVRRKKAPC
jgi:predicted nicotinamide N-methyase